MAVSLGIGRLASVRHSRKRRCVRVRALPAHLWWPEASRDRFPDQGESPVEGSAAYDVRTDAQPVRVQVGIAYPGLQITGELRMRRGKPEKIALASGQLHLGDEEVVISG